MGVNLNKETAAKSKNTGSIVIGKDILELLSHAMYVEPLSVYREYIQNSADSIDEAKDFSLYKNKKNPRIDISISQATRSVKILDNGAGIKKATFKRRITAFGASKKRGSDARGFRGVGRLAGLGYCQQLIFRTRAPEEENISEIVWDCRKIVELLRDHSFKGDLKDVVNDVVQFNNPILENYPDHFFEVELKKISRLKNDILLNELEIEKYIAQVGPVTFSPEFKYKNKIEEYLAEHGVGKDFKIFLNNANDPICKPHQNTLQISESLLSKYDSPTFFEIPGANGSNSAIGWRLDHGYLGAIPPNLGVKGFRARAGNIQIGDESLLSEIFVEKRFNSWTVGEVHILDKKIQPNGRRDNFSQNQPYLNLLNHLTLQSKKISQLCRELSITRNREKEFYLEREKVEEKLSILNQSTVPKNFASTLKKEIGSSLAIMDKLSKSSDLFDDKKSRLAKDFSKTHSKVEKILNMSNDEDPLAKLPRNKRGIYKEVIGLIYECTRNESNAKALVDKIIARISGMN